MINKIIKKITNCSFFLVALSILGTQFIDAQVSGPIPQKIKWFRIGALQSWFSNGGVEIEYGRRGRSGFLNTDQVDGLNWPGDFNFQDVSVGQSMWIGTTDFIDPVKGITYPYKVVCGGRINMYLGQDIFPVSMKMIAKSPHPDVYVDDVSSSFLEYDDVPDEYDENIPSDRLIINKFNTSMGISCTRKVYAYSQQNNDDYFIYEYVFKNTGIIDASGEKKLDKTLTDVVFHWQYRYGFPGESYREGWVPTGVSWGLNTVNNCVGQDNNHLDPVTPEMRAVWAHYGPVSSSSGYADDIGLPRRTSADILAGTNYAGVVTLYADKSAQEHVDDPKQPFTTKFMPSDRGAQGVDQYDASLMARKYTEFMTAGHPASTHEEQVGSSYANTWGGDAGGYASAMGYGPYTMAPGDSVKIIFAQAVSGIMKDREHVRDISYNWFNDTGNFIMPDGSNAGDRNTYKNAWVLSGKDSLFQTFRRAMAAYNNGLEIPQAPPAPQEFKVVSAGSQISLSWSDNAESWPNFDGYEIYRAAGRYDTTFTKVFECNRSTVTNTFQDDTPRRGFNYYYYIVSKDDGSTNIAEPGVPLKSSKFLTLTTREAYLTRPPGKNFSQLRIVPNPFHIQARAMQFGTDAPDRIAFYDLPGKCLIKIFTESGSLVETIEHTKNTGDVLYHSLTSSRQLLVSGLYIVYFEVTEDLYDDQTGELLFQKGDNTIKKLIVIR